MRSFAVKMLSLFCGPNRSFSTFYFASFFEEIRNPARPLKGSGFIILIENKSGYGSLTAGSSHPPGSWSATLPSSVNGRIVGKLEIVEHYRRKAIHLADFVLCHHA
jgi:hypothetical protein